MFETFNLGFKIKLLMKLPKNFHNTFEKMEVAKSSMHDKLLGAD